MFGDRSEDVFLCCSFFSSPCENFTRNTSWHSSRSGKARVAPMEALSFPKLELQTALLASRLKEDIIKVLTFPVSNTFMWTDSTTVLHWLNSCSKQPTIVANRIEEILESTTVDQWFHVLSGDNHADTGTREISAESLRKRGWVNGPSLL